MKKVFIVSMLLLVATTTFAEGVYCFFRPETGVYEDAHLKVAILVNGSTAQLVVYNKTNEILYLDKGNSFAYKNNEPVCLFQNSSYTTGKTNGGGGSVNLGSVASVLGIGGAIGTIASGANVGGGSSVQNTTTTYEQRVLGIAPQATYVIHNWEIKETDIKFDIPKGKVKKGNNWVFYENNSPFSLKAILKYSIKEDFTESEMVELQTHVSAIIVDKAKGVKSHNLQKTKYCSQFADVPFYAYYDINIGKAFLTLGLWALGITAVSGGVVLLVLAL